MESQGQEGIPPPPKKNVWINDIVFLSPSILAILAVRCSWTVSCSWTLGRLVSFPSRPQPLRLTPAYFEEAGGQE